MTPPRQRRPDSGQAAVELALALPVVTVVVLGVIQVLAVVADQLAIELAAREAARAAAVAPDPSGAAGSAARAAVGLAPLGVSTSNRSDRVTVTVSYVNHTDVPLIGRVIGDIELRAEVTMRREPP